MVIASLADSVEIKVWYATGVVYMTKSLYTCEHFILERDMLMIFPTTTRSRSFFDKRNYTSSKQVHLSAIWMCVSLFILTTIGTDCSSRASLLHFCLHSLVFFHLAIPISNKIMHVRALDDTSYHCNVQLTINSWCLLSFWFVENLR